MRNTHAPAAGPDSDACDDERLRTDAQRIDMDSRRLLHELLVYQAELELQNAALRESRAEVEISRQRYAELYALAPISFLTLQPDGTIQQANAAASQLLLGRPDAAALQGSRFGAFVDDDAIATFNAFLDHAFAERGEQSVEVPLRDRDTGTTVVLVTAIADTTGTCRAALTDISTLKRAEHELARQANELRESDRRKDEFLAILGHELRNPLAPIVSAADTLQGAGTDDPAVVRWAAAIIKRQTDHLVHLVDDLLNVTRISQGKIALSKESIDLEQLLTDVMAVHRAEADARGQSLTLTQPPHALWVEADRVRLVQTFDNLVENAVKYTPPGGRIELSLGAAGDDAVVAVQDTGIGIARPMLPRVFDLFTQAEPARSQSRGGLGVGLALTKRLVELHGGSIEARSDGLGRGSSFVVRLPRFAATPLPAAAATRDNPALPTPRRILIVDDEREIADTLSFLLAARGHSVQTAYDGEEALAIVAEASFDVVILDIRMPRLGGLEVARRLRSQPRLEHLTLIAMTGFGTATDAAASTAAGFDWHLVKPVRLSQLETILDRGVPPRPA